MWGGVITKPLRTRCLLRTGFERMWSGCGGCGAKIIGGRLRASKLGSDWT